MNSNTRKVCKGSVWLLPRYGGHKEFYKVKNSLCFGHQEKDQVLYYSTLGLIMVDAILMCTATSVRYANEVFDYYQDMADIRSFIKSRTPYVLAIKKKIELLMFWPSRKRSSALL